MWPFKKREPKRWGGLYKVEEQITGDGRRIFQCLKMSIWGVWLPEAPQRDTLEEAVADGDKAWSRQVIEIKTRVQ